MRTIARQRARAAAWRVGFALGLAALLSAATVAWGGVGVTVTVGGTSVSVAQPACPASPQVSPTSVSFSAAGDPRIELTVHEEAACVLNYIGSLTADQEWIAAYATHQGSPTEPLITQLWIEVTDNTGPARSGTVMVGGTSVSVAQASGQAPECPGSPSVLPASLGFLTTSAGSNTVTVQAAAGCSYGVSDDQAWITATPSPVAGNGPVTIELTENTSGAQRTGTVTVGGTSVIVTQASGCPGSPSVSPESVSFSAAGDPRIELTVHEEAACVLNYIGSLTADQEWIAAYATHQGSPTDPLTTQVWIEVTDNTGPARTGTVTVGGTSVSVAQASGCPGSPSVSPESVSFGSGASSQTVTVQATEGCSYTVSDDQTWIMATLSNGSVTIDVTENTSGATRTGTVTVGGTSVIVTQASGCPGSPSVSPESVSFSAAGDPRIELTVHEEAACLLNYIGSLTADQEWIAAYATHQGSPTDPLTTRVWIEVTDNTGPARTGTVTVGGTSVSVAQASGCPGSPSVSPESVSFGSGASSQTVTVQATEGCSYTVSDDQTWIMATLSNGSVTIDVTENTSGATRTGTVTVGGTSVSVAQASGCPGSPSVSPESVSFGSGASSQTVTVQATEGCSYTVSDDQTWIMATLSNGSVTIDVTENTSGATRTGTVTVGGTSVIVTQASGCPGSPSVSPESVSFSAAGDPRIELTVHEEAACVLNYIGSLTADQEWIAAYATHQGSPTDPLTTRVWIEVTDNTGPARTGTVTVGGTSVSVAQASGCPGSPSVSPESVSFGSGASSQTVTVQATEGCSYTVSDDQTWIMATLSNGSVTIDVTENTSGATRTGTVTVGGTSVIVTQASGCPGSPSVSPESVSFSAAGDPRIELTVHEEAACVLNYIGSLTADQEWIAAYATHQGSPTDPLTTRVWIEVTDNTGPARTGTVTVGGTSVSVAQASGCPGSPSVSPESVSFGSGASSQTVTVQATEGCSYTVSDDQTWIMATLSNGSVTIDVTENTSGATRTGTVTVGGTSVIVTQASGCPGSPSVSPESVSFSAAGDPRIELTVHEEAACVLNYIGSLTADQEWIAAYATHQGSPTDPLTTRVWIEVTDNTGPARTGTVTVGGTSVSVAQASGCPGSPSVSPESVSFGSGASSQTVTVQATEGCSYTVSDDQTWIMATLSNGSVTIDVTENTSGATRTGTVTVGGTSVSVAQASGCPGSPSVSPESVSFGSGASSQTVTVQATEGCSYTVSDDQTWIMATLSNGSVTIDVTENTSGATRTGTVTVGGTSVIVTQASGCPGSPSVSPESVSFSAAGDPRIELTVHEEAACLLNYIGSLTADQEWIAAYATHQGSPTDPLTTRVWIEVTDNTGPARTGTVTVGGTSVIVTQASGCPGSPSVSPESVSFSAAGDPRIELTVHEEAACLLNYIGSLTADQEWIAAYATHQGSPTDPLTTQVWIEVTDNTGPARTGTVTVGGTSVSVAQAAGSTPCPGAPDSVFPAAVLFNFGPGTSSVSVSGRSDCAWAVSADQSWITVTPVTPATVSGGGTVSVAVTANSSAEGRSGTVMIGGLSVPVTHEELRLVLGGCSYFVGPVSVDVPTEGGQGTLWVSWEYVPNPHTPMDEDESVCGGWVVNSPSSWISASKIDSRTVAYTIDANDVLTPRRGPIIVNDVKTFVRQGDFDAALTAERDRLLADWAPRIDQSNVCDAWHTLEESDTNVFIWNTHRLYKSYFADDAENMLEHVTELYSIKGQDGDDCGGGEHNRTFMSVTPALRDKMVATFREQEGGLPAWKQTDDRACGWMKHMNIILLGAIPDCPHRPFTYQIETKAGDPTGQIQFFGRYVDGVPVRRTYYSADGQTCANETFVVPGNEVCVDGCDEERNFPRTPEWEDDCLSTYYEDQVLRDPSATYVREAVGYRIHDEFSFEMDQDYNWFRNAPVPHVLSRGYHDSAPACNNMTSTYSIRYGDPVWHWTPSACGAASQPGGRFTHADSVQVRTTPARAVYVEELRARIDGLRGRFGLTAFAWTDAPITVGVTPVKAVHLTELRTALAAAYAAAGRDVPVYADPAIVAGVTLIRAVHVTELRAAVVALER